MFTKIKTVAISLTTCALLATSASAEDLIINFDDLNHGPKRALKMRLPHLKLRIRTLMLRLT